MKSDAFVGSTVWCACDAQNPNNVEVTPEGAREDRHGV